MMYVALWILTCLFYWVDADFIGTAGVPGEYDRYG